jgi:MoaA/NifB/PqqE/SkfB family radical SAM enzyme
MEGIMNKYLEPNRLEFTVTEKCSGKCKHCSVGEKKSNSHIDVEVAKNVVNDLSKKYSLNSIMTFGGEPLLYSDTVCQIHTMANECNIKHRDIITNGYFSKNKDIIDKTSENICKSNASDVLLSVDAFHQETIPLEPVKYFAESLLRHGVLQLRTHPAWLVNEKDINPYNEETHKIINEFRNIGIEPTEGNIIFPAGNAVKYLGKYFSKIDAIDIFSPCGSMPYTGKLDEITSLGINPNGDVLVCSIKIGNVYENSIIDIVNNYDPYEQTITKILIEGGVRELYEYVINKGISVELNDCYSSCMLCNKLVNIINGLK